MRNLDEDALKRLIEESLMEAGNQHETNSLDPEEKDLYIDLFNSLGEEPNFFLPENFSDQLLLKIERKEAFKHFIYKILFTISLVLATFLCMAILYLYQINLPQSLLQLISFVQKPMLFAALLWVVIEVSDILFVKRHTITHSK